MLSFVYDPLPSRVVFGDGSLARLPAEIERLGLARPLIIHSASQAAAARRVAGQLGERSAGTYDEVVMHVPIEVARRGQAEAERRGADGCIAIGGGSTVGLAKAIAVELGLPIVAVPTTYAGSEMTPIQGITEAGIKRTRRDPKMLPRTVLYDPELTLTLAPRIAGPSGMNAIAHCVEALYAKDANPISSLMAEEGIRALAGALPRIVAVPADRAARSEALYGAWLAGAALGAVGMGLHHKLCHTLGGSFDLPHAETHTIILPHAAAYNRTAAGAAMARVARALGSADAPEGLFDLAARLGAPPALRDLGLRHDDLDRAAALATTAPYPNPRPVTRAAVRALLEEAFFGRRPARPAPGG